MGVFAGILGRQAHTLEQACHTFIKIIHQMGCLKGFPNDGFDPPARVEACIG